MVRWHHWHDGHEFEQALGVGDGQRSLAVCSPWGYKESDRTEQLNWTENSKEKCEKRKKIEQNIWVINNYNKIFQCMCNFVELEVAADVKNETNWKKFIQKQLNFKDCDTRIYYVLDNQNNMKYLNLMEISLQSMEYSRQEYPSISDIFRNCSNFESGNNF